MSKFTVREAANTAPDLMGDTYEFVKLNLDEFVSFVDGLTDPVAREVGPVALFLETTRPDHHWYVTPTRIYYTSNAPYREDQIEVLTAERREMVWNGWPYPQTDEHEVVWPAGTVFVKAGEQHPNKFSEPQKWVTKIEGWAVEHSDPSIPQAVVRKWVKDATGK